MTRLTIETENPETIQKLITALADSPIEISGRAPVGAPVDDTPMPSDTAGAPGDDDPDSGPSQESDDGGAQTSTGTDPLVDENGVAKNAKYCADAKKPFYASGKRKGQWKKAQAVTEEEYDAWYAGALAEANADGSEDESPATAASAFAGGATQQDTLSPAPTDGGQLMAWVSEHQTAGYFTQEDVNQVYAQLQIGMPQLFAGSPEDIARHVANVYNSLLAFVQ